MDNVLGYVYNDKGMHDGAVMFEGTDRNIANFIMYNSNSRVVVTDMLDQFIVSSVVGGWLDQIDYEKRDGIMKYLLPLQYGERKPVKVKEVR